MYERWIRTVLRFRIAVVLVWIAVAGAGVYATTNLPPLLSNSFSVPGTDSDRARLILQDSYGDRPEGTFTVVFRVHRPGRTARAELRRRLLLAAVARAGGACRALASGWRRAVRGRRDDARPPAREALHRRSAERAARGGGAAGARDGPTGHSARPRSGNSPRTCDAARQSPSHSRSPVLVFMSSARRSPVFIPFAFAACTIAGTVAAVAERRTRPADEHVRDESRRAHRLRACGRLLCSSIVSPLPRGTCPERHPLFRTRSRARCRRRGRAVVFSGLAVATGLALLLFVPVPFIRSMGARRPARPARLDRGRADAPTGSSVARRAAALSPRALARRPEEGAWATLSRWIIAPAAFPWCSSAALRCCLALAGPPALALRVTPGSFEGIPHAPPSLSQGLRVSPGTGSAPGAVTPTHVVIDVRCPVARSRDLNATGQRARLVWTPRCTSSRAERGRRTSTIAARFSRVIVVGRHEYGEPPRRGLSSNACVTRRCPRTLPTDGGGASAGSGAGRRFPRPSVRRVARGSSSPCSSVTFFVLLRAFRSIVLPLKAVLLNVLTVAAVYGLLSAVVGRPRSTAGSRLPLRDALRAVDGLRGLPRAARPRVAGSETGDNALAVAHGLERPDPYHDGRR